LLCNTQCVEAAHPDYNGGNNCFTNALRSALEHDLPHEILTGEEVNARFPGYNLPADFKVPPSPLPNSQLLFPDWILIYSAAAWLNIRADVVVATFLLHIAIESLPGII
jgi:hypothetical protein